ncbi:MAG: hypothetical protein DDT40_01345 [candidate division WS2 bacterium]|uniref:Uncharacterized protein n=1 Tax=Psychracetigena formicireducens TaxID=2986056 RepID=A0A9E2BHQ7_PSYF1|nr:hypothetical protein [Candidatus Psychracetigena formicireducens]MBT9145102.1 hypothetical protein [Candidatus Psychracetigena formicireducens]MBT9151160.1 hypothetical protein [Candidatus Psychracetigena formicireducens]
MYLVRDSRAFLRKELKDGSSFRKKVQFSLGKLEELRVITSELKTPELSFDKTSLPRTIREKSLTLFVNKGGVPCREDFSILKHEGFFSGPRDTPSPIRKDADTLLL